MASEKRFQVTNVKPRLITIAGVAIGPGATTGENGVEHIPPEHVEGVRKSAVFRGGHLVEGKAEIPTSAPMAIEKLDIESAKKLISAETDISVLSTWADADNRQEITAAIKTRLFLLK